MGKINLENLADVSGIQFKVVDNISNEEHTEEIDINKEHTFEISDENKTILTGLGYTEDDLKNFKEDEIKTIVETGKKKEAVADKDEKKYHVGGKWYNDTEINEQVNTHFKGKIDIEKMDAETRQIYVDTYLNAKAGMNKKQWQKAQGQRDQDLKDLKTQLEQKENELNERERRLKQKESASATERAELEKIAKIDLSDEQYDDLSADDRTNMIYKINEAKKRIREIDGKEKTDLKEKTDQIEAERNRILFEKYLNQLAIVYTDLRLQEKFAVIIQEHQSGKRNVKDPEVRKAYGLYRLINDALEQGMDPVLYYELYNEQYPEFKVIEKPKTPAEIEAENKIKSQKAKQDEKKPDIPSGGSPDSTTSQKTGDLIKGKSFNEKFQTILKGTGK